jgi:hypothetical protein
MWTETDIRGACKDIGVLQVSKILESKEAREYLWFGSANGSSSCSDKARPAGHPRHSCAVEENPPMNGRQGNGDLGLRAVVSSLLGTPMVRSKGGTCFRTRRFSHCLDIYASEGMSGWPIILAREDRTLASERLDYISQTHIYT